MASAAQIAAAQKLADEMAAAAEGEDSDDAPLESLVTVRHNGAADRDDASDDEVMPTPKRRGPPTDGDAALAAALDADLAARKPLPDFRRDGPRVGETIRRKVERPTGTAWAEGKIIGYLGPDESDFVDANGAKAALYRVRYESGLRELVGDEEDLEEWEINDSSADRSPLDDFGRPANSSDGDDGEALSNWAPFTPRAAPARAPPPRPPRPAVPAWAPLDAPPPAPRPEPLSPGRRKKKRPLFDDDDASAGSLEAELAERGRRIVERTRPTERDPGSDSEEEFVPGALDVETLRAMGLVAPAAVPVAPAYAVEVPAPPPAPPVDEARRLAAAPTAAALREAYAREQAAARDANEDSDDAPAAPAEDSDSDDAPLESLITVRRRDDSSDDD